MPPKKSNDCPFQTVQQAHNGKENCCGVIFNKPCSDAQMKKLFTPLEVSFPKIFGEFDDQQHTLENIAPPVNLLENAADFVRCMKEQPNFLENIINKIIDDNKSDFIFLGSETFPFLLKEKTHKYIATDYGKDYDTGEPEEQYENAEAEQKDKYDNAVMTVKQNFQKGKNKYMLHIGGDFGIQGGHYAVVIQNGKDLILYDSMQIQGFSFYSPFFLQVAFDVFGKMPSILPHESCPQPTGGFVQDDQGDYALQDIDSQNHYCYMWAIWYFHIFVVKGLPGVKKEFKKMKNTRIHLVYIKKYIWSLLMYMYPTDNELKKFITLSISEDKGIKINPTTSDFLLRFFMMNFRYIWFDCAKGKFHLYSVIGCDISKFRSFTNMNDCLDYSLAEEPLVLDTFT